MSSTPDSSQPPNVVQARVTEARASRLDDQNARLWKYLVLNGMRVVCLFAIFLTPYPWGLIWILGAVVLPYAAVVIANNVGEAHPGSLSTPDTVTAQPLAITQVPASPRDGSPGQANGVFAAWQAREKSQSTYPRGGPTPTKNDRDCTERTPKTPQPYPSETSNTTPPRTLLRGTQRPLIPGELLADDTQHSSNEGEPY